jgi:SET domain-containing protein
MGGASDKKSTKTKKSKNSPGTTKNRKKSRKAASSPSARRTSPCWEVRPSPVHGRGVFATRKIEADEVVHVAPVLLFSDEEYDHLAQTLLVDYVFEWHQGGVALALGVGGLFNHDANANLRYELCDDDDPARPGHSYVAERRIEKGEELTINYGDEYAEWHGWI